MAYLNLTKHITLFRELSNEHRPHRALKRVTPGTSYRATPKAAPAGTGGQQHFRARMDKIDETGKVSLRYAGKLRHLGIGRLYKHEKVRILTADTDVIVIHHDTGEILAEFTLDPSRDYQTKKKHPDPKTGV